MLDLVKFTSLRSSPCTSRSPLSAVLLLTLLKHHVMQAKLKLSNHFTRNLSWSHIAATQTMF